MDIIPPPLHEQGPVLDRAHLARMTMGDEALSLEVLGMFRNQTEMWMRLLGPEIETKDWAGAVHTIKGSARGVGAWPLAQICEDAEADAKVRGPLSAGDKIYWREKIAVAIDAVIGEIARVEHQMALFELRRASNA
jgi:HPt (histidine-containing phosphotransfer) domain-containing protein